MNRIRVASLTCAVSCMLAWSITSARGDVPASPLAPDNLGNTAPGLGITAARSGPGGQPYCTERWFEDYSYLKDASLRKDPLDPLKYIPLDGDGDVYLTLGGQVRERYEYFNHNNWGAGSQDHDGYYLTRVLGDVDLHLGPNIRIFAQVESSTIDQRIGGPRPTDSDVFDLDEGFVDFRLPFQGKDGLTFRLGRQELVYGAERLISSLDWVNVRRTFEGAKASLVTGNNQLDAWVTRPIITYNQSPDQENYDAVFSGVYDTLKLPDVLPHANTRLELYGLGLDRTKTPTLGTQAAIGVGSDTYTVGGRIATLPKPFDLDIEGDYQFGRYNKASLSAFSLALDGGYTFDDAPLRPRVAMGFDIASGSSNPLGPDRETFNQLFPLGHRYFGFIDVIGRQNIIDAHPTLILKPTKNVTLRGEYHLFWREDTGDGAYAASGALIRGAGGSTARFIGSEADLLLDWQIDRHWSTYAGYSHFFAGGFIDQTGPHHDIDFAYVAVTFTF